MKNAVFIVVNSQEFVCDKKYIMEKSPVIKEYFTNNEKEENYICQIDSFQGNESNFKNFLNGKTIKVTYDMIPFIVNLSNVFKLNCFDDQIKFLQESNQQFIKDIDQHFVSYENFSNIVIEESFDMISKELTAENCQFFARSFLTLFFLRPRKIKEYKNLLKKEEARKNIPIFEEIEKLLKMKHFLFRFRDNFLSVFQSPLFLKHFNSEIDIELTLNENESKLLTNNYISKLYSIVEVDDVDSLQLFVSNPEFDIDQLFYGVSLIEYAAFLSSIKCFKFLLSNHAQIDRRTIKFAVAGGNAEIIHLCEQKFDVFENTLEISVAFHHQKIFNWLLETKNQKINEEVIKNCFLYSNFIVLKQIIVDQSIPLNDLLIHSAEFGQFSFFKWISSFPGIDIDHKNSKGITSLHFGCLNDDFHLVEFILNCPLSESVNVNSKILYEDVSPLHIVCKNNNIEIAKLLLSNPKIDVNSQTFYTNRMTPLHLACKYGNYEIVDLLLKNESININAMTYDHATPFYYACKKGFIKIVKLLMQYKADTKIVNQKNITTPILIAGINNHFDIVKLLISSENVNDETKTGETLLLLSSKSGNIELTKELIFSYKVNIHQKNQKGLNALHFACKGNDNKEIVNFLISNGFDLQEETKNIFFIKFFL